MTGRGTQGISSYARKMGAAGSYSSRRRSRRRSYAKRMTLASGISIDDLDPGIRPQDDLFRHVNGRRGRGLTGNGHPIAPHSIKARWR